MSTNQKDQNTAGPTATLPVRKMARELYDHLILDIWPGSATIVDYGLDTTDHYGAIQYEVKHRGLTMEQLDDAMGNGPALTALIQSDNPYYGVKFETPWDGMLVSIRAWANAEPGGKFPLGRLFATPCALNTVPREEINRALSRHVAGDFGDVSPEEAERNFRAVEKGHDIESYYRTQGGAVFRVVTEGDRSLTVVGLEFEG